MASTFHRPWADAEKNYMLAEILKAQSPHPTVLLNLINKLNTGFDWEDIALPPGRTLRSCRDIFNELRRGAAQQTAFDTTARSSQSSTNPQMSANPSSKRPFQSTFESPMPQTGRHIAPKPPSGSMPPTQPAAPPTTQPAPRKRGRPRKTPYQARPEAGSSMVPLAPRAATESEASAPTSVTSPESVSALTPSITSVPTLTPEPSSMREPQTNPFFTTLSGLPGLEGGSSFLSPLEERPPATRPPVTRLSISAIMSTPTTQAPGSQSGSSSGKKRRRGGNTRVESDERASRSPALIQRPPEGQLSGSPYGHRSGMHGERHGPNEGAPPPTFPRFWTESPSGTAQPSPRPPPPPRPSAPPRGSPGSSR